MIRWRSGAFPVHSVGLAPASCRVLPVTWLACRVLPFAWLFALDGHTRLVSSLGGTDPLT